jgi:hypothetical protein
MGKHKELIEKLKEDHPRVEFYGLHYYEICRDAWNKVKESKSEIEKIRKNMPKPVRKDDKVKLCRFGKKHRLLINEIRRQESVTIAFAAMCLESCIWDYAACNTSQDKVEQNFKSLNLVAKWVIIPQLLCGSDITKVVVGSTCFLDMLRKLTKKRNDLVHSKSKPLPHNLKDAIKAIIPKESEIAAEEAFGLIKALLGELEKADKTDWWFFKSKGYIDFIKKTL